MLKEKRGFTLIELLIVIAIIGVLSSVVIGSLNRARESGKVAQAVASVKNLRTTIEVYSTDVGSYPTTDCMVEPTLAATCSASSDPFSISLGVSGWSGPYTTLWNVNHPWGGHIGYEYGGDDGGADGDGDGAADFFIFLDDDAAGGTQSSNAGIIPLAELLKLDSILDDGNLSTGNMRGNNNSWSNQGTAVGEAAIKYDAR